MAKRENWFIESCLYTLLVDQPCSNKKYTEKFLSVLDFNINDGSDNERSVLFPPSVKSRLTFLFCLTSTNFVGLFSE